MSITEGEKEREH